MPIHSYDRPGGYAETLPDDFSDSDSLPPMRPSARPRPAFQQSAPPLGSAYLPPNSHPAPRPVYRHTAPPPGMFDQNAYRHVPAFGANGMPQGQYGRPAAGFHPDAYRDVPPARVPRAPAAAPMDAAAQARLSARFDPRRPPVEPTVSFDQDALNRLAARFVPREPTGAAQRPAQFRAPYVPYRQPNVRRHSPDPAQNDYTRAEIAFLRNAGFHAEERRRLTLVSDRQFQYVMEHAGALADCGFGPNAILDAARLPPDRGSFVAREAHLLDEMAWHPTDMIDLAGMPPRQRTFVMVHADCLREIGFSPLQIMLMARRPAAERSYLVLHGVELRDRGYSIGEIRRRARDYARGPVAAPRTPRQFVPEPAPSRSAPRERETRTSLPVRTLVDPDYPPPATPQRRASTTEMARLRVVAPAPSRRHAGRDQPAGQARIALTPAERQGFDDMGLADEALDQLARSSDTVRAYMLVHGGNLIAGGMSFDEVFTMAGDAAGPASERPAPRRRNASGDIGRRPAASPVPSFSWLTVEDIGNDPSLAGIRTPPQRTRSPEPMEARRVTHPRNNAPLHRAERDMLDHAHARWGHEHYTRADAENFYRETVPEPLARLLAAPRQGAPDGDDGLTYFNLLLLFAGAPHAEDNRQGDTAPQHLARMRMLANYLLESDDPALLRACDTSAAEGVAACGDRVAHGITAVDQIVLQRKIEREELTHRGLVEGKEKIFLQPRVENIAVHLANARKYRETRAAAAPPFTRASFAAHVEESLAATFVRGSGNEAGITDRLRSAFRTMFRGEQVADHSARESLEMYAALAPLLLQHGVNLVESAQHSTYGGMYRIEPLELDYALAEVHRHVRDVSEDFWAEFAGKRTIETLLRQCFQDDLRTMRAEREALQEEADEAIFSPNPSPGTDARVRDMMATISSMEKVWYREKFKELMARRHLMDNPPPLAPDLAGE